MLNIFPELLMFSLLAPLLLRVTVGFLFLSSGSLKFGNLKKEKIDSFNKADLRPEWFWVALIGTIEFVGGILLILGLFTQIAALILSVIALGGIILKDKDAQELPTSLGASVLILAVLLSLILTGAGLYAIDIPL